MLFEYAVEPKAISLDLRTCQYLSSLFGFDRGRLLSLFPRKWLPMAIQATDHLPDTEKKRVVEKLVTLKRRASIKSGRSYDIAIDSWLENAIKQHNLKPFHAIVATEGCDHASIVCIDDFDIEHELVTCPPIRRVKRTGQDIANAMATLLKEANTILFVDPYLDISSAENRETLKACLEIIASNISPVQKCEVHFGHMDRLGSSTDIIEGNIERWLDDVLPDGISVIFYNWEKKDRGEDFHARYLLTEKGGLSIDAGFRARGHHQTVDMSLLDQAFCVARLDDFKRNSTVYELVEPVVEVFSDGRIVHL